MQKAKAQQKHAHGQPAQRQGGGVSLESPRGEQLMQVEAMAESSPQAGKLAQLAAMADASPAAAAQRRMMSMVDNSQRMTVQRKAVEVMHNSRHATVQRRQLDRSSGETGHREEVEGLPQPEVAQRAEALAKPNNTGLPDNLKNGIESLSGISMDSTRVHYNSAQPAQLNALAYAQGTDIHVAPGQEKHLPHEAWHVVQQAQGRVKPTMRAKGTPVNDDQGLEHEADMMGARALQTKGGSAVENMKPGGGRTSATTVAQRQLVVDVTRAHSTEQEEVSVDDLGYADVLLLEYAQLMKDDASAIVKPNNAVAPGSKASAVKAKLDAVQLDTNELQDKFVDKLMAGNDWQEMDESTMEAIKEEMQQELDGNPDYQDDQGASLYKLSDDETWKDVLNDPGGYGLNVQDIIKTQIGKDLAAVSSTGDLSGLNRYSEVWKRTLAFAAYEITKDGFYPIVGQAVAAAAGSPQVPFLKLINDLNAGLIQQLDFVEKYNSASGLGAEFEVAAPAAKKTEYDGKAVVHTHYAAADKQPNYGHTKPYVNRKARGYGYTTVNLGKIKGMDDSQKEYDQL